MNGSPILRRYGESTTIVFPLYSADGSTLVSGATYASGDVKIIKNEGSASNSTNSFTDETNGTYSIVLTASEMQAARILIVVDDQTSPDAWLPMSLTIETYANASAQHVFDPVDIAADVQSLLDKLGAFTGTGVNTVLGFLRAMSRKDLSSPSDMGGNYDPATDSLEALRDLIVTTNLVGAVSSSYDLSTFIGRSIQRIRQLTNETAISPKYSDSQILSYMQASFETVIHEVNSLSDAPIIVRHNITLSSATQDYILPPNVGEILAFEKILTDSDEVEWEIRPRSRWSVAGPGFTLEGNVLRVSPVWKDSDTLRLSYIPSGDVMVHTASTSSHSASTVVFPASPSNGSLDKRPNSYAGSILRVISATWADGGSYVQERIISSYDALTRTATVRPAFSPAPTTGTLTYEVVPILWSLVEMAVCFHTASLLLASEGAVTKRSGLERKYAEALRILRLRASNQESRVGGHFESDTRDNDRAMFLD